jgi:hypothetical protein
MSVAVIVDFRGATLEQYDQAIQKMGFSPEGTGGPGCLFHWVTATDDGIRVTDVWESREQFEKFAQDEIGPRSQEVGFPGPPQTTFHDVHNHLTAG